jgi:DNA-binding PadR family transcriptional regulator
VRSTVNAGVLSLVIEKPSYGGEIGRRFERRYEGLLSSGAQHIYKALEDLERQGLIERIELDEPDWPGQPTSGYRATKEGAQAYRSWLRTPIPASAQTRREVMIRLASTRPEDLETAERLLDVYEHAVLELLRKSAPPPSAGVIDQLLDEERRTVGDAQVRWVARARDLFRERAARRGP